MTAAPPIALEPTNDPAIFAAVERATGRVLGTVRRGKDYVGFGSRRVRWHPIAPDGRDLGACVYPGAAAYALDIEDRKRRREAAEAATPTTPDAPFHPNTKETHDATR